MKLNDIPANNKYLYHRCANSYASFRTLVDKAIFIVLALQHVKRTNVSVRNRLRYATPAAILEETVKIMNNVY